VAFGYVATCTIVSQMQNIHNYQRQLSKNGQMARPKFLKVVHRLPATGSALSLAGM